MNLVIATCLLSLVFTLGSSAPESSASPAPRMAADNGAPWLLMKPLRKVPTTWHGAASAKATLDSGTARGLSLATADFDEDGMPDVVAGYDSGNGGLFALHRGNVDAVYPNAHEAQERKKAGTFTSAPFLPDADLFGTPERADFIGAGDFDADGHWDVVAASRGGESLWLHLGDGNGGFAPAERIALTGRVTAFVTGEINRRDGLTDIVVGVTDASGARALVFEGPDGALRRDPEVLPLPSPATDFVLERLDDGSTLDLAVAAGKSLVIVTGRDRKLSYALPKGVAPPGPAGIDQIELNFDIETLAAGDFDGDGDKDLALLDTEGLLHIEPAREARRFADEAPADRIGTPAAAAWQGTRSPVVTEQRRARLLAVRMSALPGDDLLLMDRTGRELHVRLAAGERPDGPNAQEAREAAGTWASREMRSQGRALLPMRLNSDGLTDLAVLSEGAAGIAAFGPGIASVFTVTNTNDSGMGSLRDAIAQANAAAGADTITFNIAGAGPHLVQILSNPPLITEAVTIDGTTQPGYSGNPIVGIDGTLLSGPSRFLSTFNGFSIMIRGLLFTNMNLGLDGLGHHVISLNQGGSNVIESCFFGTDTAGTSSQPLNGSVIAVMNNSDGNVIGGTTAAARNLIANADRGITVNGAPTEHPDGTLIVGNYIGTDVTGLVAMGNSFGGIAPADSAGTTIGGTTAGAGNVIAGTGSGLAQIQIGAGSEINDVIVQGNIVGLAADGATPLSCLTTGCNGIIALNHVNTLIGGTTPAARNVISGNVGHMGNGTHGIYSDPTSPGFMVQGNFIGTDITGTVAVANDAGILLLGDNGVIGGTAAGAGNLISGNSAAGVEIHGTGATLQGNLIGTDNTGSFPLANGNGVFLLFTAQQAEIGTGAGGGNLISGNTGTGVIISGTEMVGNSVRGNLIGTDASGLLAVGNGGNGISVNGYPDTAIGGSSPGDRNVISGNTGDGVRIQGAGAYGTILAGNYIGLGIDGLTVLPNATGVRLSDGANKTHVGVDASQPNLISGNSIGVSIVGPTTTGNFVQGNYIGTDHTGLAALGNTSYGVEVENAPGNVIGGSLPGERNVISGNLTGVSLREAATATTLFKGNYIGTTSTGEGSLGNTGPGLEIIRSGGNEIGGPGPGDRNVFAGNSPNLWLEEVLSSAGVTGNTFENNYFGLSASGATVLGGGGSSVIWFFTDGTIFKNNVVVGANFHGLRLGVVSGAVIHGNLIGITPGFSAAGNGQSGILILGPGSDGNFIGGANSTVWNAIAYNGEAGIRIEAGNVHNVISGNYILDNGGLGIDLENDGVTANDPGDGDTGANNRQNFPVITSATTTSGSVAVSGTIDSTPNSTFAVQVYRNMSCDPSGHGEGLERIGTALAMTDGTGSGTFSGTFTAGVPDTELLTALATDSGTGDTSEFSMCGALAGVPPATISTGEFAAGTSSVLSWPESPGATLYHVYTGSAPTVSSVVSAPLDSCEVGTTTSTSFATPVTDIPPPGGMLWYLIRPEGPYGVGDVEESSSGPRSQDSIGACGGSCAHDTCATGVALTSPCDPCVAMIAAVDPFCVNSNWDSFCVSEVQSVCGSMRCPASQGTCAQPLCSTGAALTAGCDVPPLSSSCVADICAVDPFCCTTAWDGVCVNEVATVCSLGCL